MIEPGKPDLLAAVGCACPYCGEPMTAERPPTRDRINPGSKGGTYDPANVAIVCLACNNDKGSLTLAQFFAALLIDGDRRALSVLWFLIRRRFDASRPA